MALVWILSSVIDNAAFILCAVMGVLHIGHAHDGVGDSVVDDCVHGDGDAVLGEELLGRHVEADGPEVQLLVGVDTRHDEEYPRALDTGQV